MRKRYLIPGLSLVAAVAYLALRRSPDGATAPPARPAQPSRPAAPRTADPVARPARPAPEPPRPPPRDPPPIPAASDYVGWLAEWNGRFPGVMVPGHSGLWSRRDEMRWHMEFYEAVSACMEPHQAAPRTYRLILWFRPSPDGWTATPELENQIQDGNGLLESTPTLEEVGWFEECAHEYLRDNAFAFDDGVAANDSDDRFFWGVYVQIL